MGYRYRLHRKDLPGTPDIVLTKYKTAIFVNGCFWHRHQECALAKVPKSNTPYWIEKLNKNVLRDKESQSLLRSKGWDVVVIWECETKRTDRIKEKISKIFTVN